MRVTIWGCRGSLATPGEETVRYGGNTSCVEVQLADGTRLILDAGTGIRRLGLRLSREAPATIHLCLTHLHLDHLEGLGFFLPLWNAATELHVWGPPSHLRTLEERITRYFSPPLFPVLLSEAPSQLRFHDTPDGVWEIGSARLLATPVLHQGPTVGYRVEGDGRHLAYIPDHDPALGGPLGGRALEWLSGYSIAQRADLLIHDAQYTEDEYADRIGWGHSSIDAAVAYGHIVDAARMLLFHHDPLHSDSDLDALGEYACGLWEGDGASPELAREGMEIALG